jgi:hypothetical protein
VAHRAKKGRGLMPGEQRKDEQGAHHVSIATRDGRPPRTEPTVNPAGTRSVT